MLRLFSNQPFRELWRCSHLVASCVTKRKVLRFLPVSSACDHHTLFVRHLNTGSPLWKDALQPESDISEKMETVDLEKWKSVMRSQAASKEKKGVGDEDEASDDEAEGKVSGGSSLDATRELVEMWRLAGRLVPEEITDEQVQSLAELTTKSARKKFLKFLAIKEGHKKARKEKQQKRKAEREASIEQSSQGGKAFLLKFWTRSLDKVLAWRSAQAMVFGQPLVFDMSYESNMSKRELENTVSQLMEVEGWNRRATEPYHLHFCNLQPDGAYKQELLKRYGEEAWDRLLITATDRQHVDMFPREQLVYLTADSPNVLHTYDPSKVYIIGGLVDRSSQSGLSLANAKRLKLATARLPLDELLHWEVGAKNLTLDQMVRIMLTLKDTGKWEEALKFVPKRKHDGFYQQKQNNSNNNRVKGVMNRDGERWTFKNEAQSLNRPIRQSGFTGRDRMAGLYSDRENTPASTRVRTSFKNSVEGRKVAGKSNTWWSDE
ncbi:tRNA methyltransferase 10 homolog C [Acanthopagrus latus]|uniref:tRNA methyltransferase 10 homolog C n=1 Tax=Acanthopagrus latus TaxID=8177 RepID=UPI00187BFC6D|nr:tRNA methyltransferase 10 homolog C [Acanthopagrus latus]